MLDLLNVEFTKTKMGLTKVVEHAKVEFVKIRSDLQAIYGNVAAAFDDMGKRIDGMGEDQGGAEQGLHSDQEPDPQGVQGPW